MSRDVFGIVSISPLLAWGGAEGSPSSLSAMLITASTSGLLTTGRASHSGLQPKETSKAGSFSSRLSRDRRSCGPSNCGGVSCSMVGDVGS